MRNTAAGYRIAVRRPEMSGPRESRHTMKMRGAAATIAGTARATTARSLPRSRSPAATRTAKPMRQKIAVLRTDTTSSLFIRGSPDRGVTCHRSPVRPNPRGELRIVRRGQSEGIDQCLPLEFRERPGGVEQADVVRKFIRIGREV